MIASSHYFETAMPFDDDDAVSSEKFGSPMVEYERWFRSEVGGLTSSAPSPIPAKM